MKTSAKAKLRALRDELLQAEAEDEAEGAQTETEAELAIRQAGIADPTPLEADDPEREPTHGKATPA